MPYEPDIAVYKKIKQLQELDVSFEKRHQGFVIEDKIMIAKKKSKWKKLGELDWYPYYGLKNLIKAMDENRLEEYAAEQEKKYTAKYGVALNPWKDKEKEKILKEMYKQ
jgi:hypothetical protein